MRIAFVVSRMSGMDETWTTIHLAHRAAELGHDVRFLTVGDVEVSPSGRVVARTDVVSPVPATRQELAHALAYRRLPRRYSEIALLDLVFLRVNPLSQSTLAAALLLAERGVPIINDPAGIARTSSKAWLATLQDVPQPRTLVTRSRASAELFAGNLDGPVVVKPVIGSGGRGVNLVKRTRHLPGVLDHMLLATNAGVVIQEYVPEAADGEKRLFVVDGHILGCYRRQRLAGEFRHNLKCGARAVACDIEATDQRIVEAIGPHLSRNGIRIAGLDVIGDKLVEVNTLNPGGVHFAETFGAQDLSGRIVSQLLPDTPKAQEAGQP